MQVLHELVRIVAKTMKITKLHKTHFMATVYKTASGNVTVYIDKLGIKWTKSKLHNAKLTTRIKPATPSGKNNNIVRNKPLKPNVLYKKPHEPSMNATAVCVNKKRPSDESDKRKPPNKRSAKR
jgi:hypothetical protein